MEEYLSHPLYTPNYCEENIWKLNEAYYNSGGRNGYVCFISNKRQQVPIWCQKKCPNEEDPVVWDYHVIFLCVSNDDNNLLVYDFDTTLPLPTHWSDYVANAFKPHMSIREQYRQCIRVVPSETFIQYFSSDRSHMYSKENNKWLSEPPSWPIISGQLSSSSHNLMKYIDCNVNEEMEFGRVYKLQQFMMWCEELESGNKSDDAQINNQ